MWIFIRKKLQCWFFHPPPQWWWVLLIWLHTSHVISWSLCKFPKSLKPFIILYDLFTHYFEQHPSRLLQYYPRLHFLEYSILLLQHSATWPPVTFSRTVIYVRCPESWRDTGLVLSDLKAFTEGLFVMVKHKHHVKDYFLRVGWISTYDFSCSRGNTTQWHEVSISWIGWNACCRKSHGCENNYEHQHLTTVNFNAYDASKGKVA